MTKIRRANKTYDNKKKSGEQTKHKIKRQKSREQIKHKITIQKIRRTNKT